MVSDATPPPDDGSLDLEALLERPGRMQRLPDGAQQLASLILDAKKPIHQRRGEIFEAIANPENEDTKLGREIGQTLIAEDSENIDVARATLLLGEVRVNYLMEQDKLNVRSVREAILEELSSLQSGKDSIFVDLPDSQISAEIGRARGVGQKRIVVLKTALLGVAEKAFETGDLQFGIDVFGDARVDMIDHEPTWAVDAMAAAVQKSDLEKPAVRSALISLLDGRIIPITSGMEERVANTSIGELNRQEIILKRAYEARDLQKEIDIKDAALRKERETREKLEDALIHKTQRAVVVGREALVPHLTQSSSYGIQFSMYEGASMLHGLWEEYSTRNELSGGRDLFGPQGYLQVLQNIKEIPGLLDKTAESLAQKQNGCLGRWKSEFDGAEGKKEWNRIIRDELLTELDGNALGVLIAAVDYDGKNLTDINRAEIMQKALEVIGQGNAQEVLKREGTRTHVQERIRKELNQYALGIKTTSEGEGADAEVAKRQFERFQSITEKAILADASVAERIQFRAKKTEQEREETILRTTALHERIQNSKKYVASLETKREEMHDKKAAGAWLQKAESDEMLDRSVHINAQDDIWGKHELDITMNDDYVKTVAGRVIKLRTSLEAESNNRQVRDALAAAETEAGLLQEMAELANMINDENNKDLFQGSGWGAKTLRQIKEDAFRALSEAVYADGWRDFDTDTKEALTTFDEKYAGSGSPTKSLEVLRGELLKQEAAERILEQGAQIEDTESALRTMEDTATRKVQDLEAKRKKGLTYVARKMVRDRLKDKLRDMNRISL